MTLLSVRRLTPPAWLRRPRRSARLRLTLLYSALFLVSGAILLAITYLLFEHAIDNGQVAGVPPHRAPPPPPTTGQLPPNVQAAIAAANRELAAQRAADLHQLLVNAGIALAIVAALAVLLGWFFAGRMLRPVRTITATARRICATSLSERLSLDDADEEFKQLGDTLDDLFARLENTFEAQRHFVANASHELRTPLTLEQALLDAVLSDPDPDAASWRDACQRALAASRQQERLLEALLTLARSESGLDRRQRVDLSLICDDVLLRPDSDTRRLHIETTIASAPLDGDPRLIERLVANLIDNAIGHNVTGGHVQIATTVTHNGNAMLSVTNTGPVIPPADIDRLFQPFQRLDPHRTQHKDGHGLGLSIVRAIAAAHHATITAHPQPEGGLRIEVNFPPPIDRDHAMPNASNARDTRQASAHDTTRSHS